MFKYVVALTFTVMSAVAFAQENNLSSFVEAQNEKLIYDESKLVQVPNTNVSIMPPEHFIADPSINGFVHSGSACTIQVIEVPGVSFRVIEASMTEEYILSQNYTFVGKTEITTETNQSGVIFFVRFRSGNTEFERAMFFTGESNTIWVNFNYPVSMKNLLFPAIEASLKSVQ